MENFKIDIDGKELSSEQIHSKKKSFDQFYSNYKAKTKPFYKKGWFLGGAGIACVAGIISTVMVFNNSSKSDTNLSDNSNPVVIHEKGATSQLKPFVNPPIEGVNVVWESFKVDAAKGGVVTNKRGSKLTFPVNAFTSSEGKLVSGEVEIRYREFMNQADIFVSGIPMTYDSANVRYQFKSAGMMEVKAFKDNKEVALTSNKQIKVELVSTQNETAYNLYELKPQKRNWECLGKDKVVPVNAVNNGNNNSSGTVDEVTKLKEELKDENGQIPGKLQDVPVFKKEERKRINILSALKKLDRKEPAKPMKANDNRVRFNLDFDRSEFPELASYNNVAFQILENQILDPKDTRKVWNDISIDKTTKKEVYKVTFKNKESMEWVSYMVNPVFEGKAYDKAKLDYDKKFADYKKKRDALLADKSNAIQRIQIIKDKWNQFKSKYKDQAKNNQATSAVKNTFASSNYYRSFDIGGFGVFNIDMSITRNKFKNKSTIKELAVDGKLQNGVTAYLIHKETNTVYTLGLANGGKLNYDKKNENYLLKVHNGGKLAVVYPKVFNDQAKKGKYNFKCSDTKISSVEDVKKVLNL